MKKKPCDYAFRGPAPLPKKRPDFSKTIGLARSVNGSYAPSNENSTTKLRALYAAANVPTPWRFDLHDWELPFLRDIAKAAGYRLVTTAGRIVKP